MERPGAEVASGHDASCTAPEAPPRPMLKLLHAADVHLDSPLRGLDRYEGAPVEELRGATRRAFENLVRLALEEGVAAVLLAGDVFDGESQDFNTALYFVRQMQALRERGIRVVLVSGNHDAQSKQTKSLRLPENVHVFGSARPETLRLDDLGLAVHGQSFHRPAVEENLAAAYPRRVAGCINVGMLHTALDGREGHDPYAPCTVGLLESKEYDYWALGHVHAREVLREKPAVVFPGNIQGRHIREVGSKGCTIVSFDARGVASLDSRSLDVLRWVRCPIDATGARDAEELLQRCEDALSARLAENDPLPIAARLELSGACPARQAFAAERERVVGELRAAGIRAGGGRVWIEKVAWTKGGREGGGEGGRGLAPAAPTAEAAADDLEEMVRGLDLSAADLAPELQELSRKLREVPGKIDPTSPEDLAALVEEARGLLLSRLAGRRAGGSDR